MLCGYNQNYMQIQKKYDEMLDEYYEIRGWTSHGVPTQAKLKELGLNSVADELKRLGKL